MVPREGDDKKEAKSMTPIGQQRLLEIVGRITQRPEIWNQSSAHCGSAHCVFGHAQIARHLAIGIVECYDHLTPFAYLDGMDWLQLTAAEANYIYSSYRSLEELQHFAITGKME